MTDTPLDAVLAYVDAFNTGDPVATSAAFGSHGSILDGTRMTQTGSTFTVALRRLSDNWRIAAWAWSKGAQQQ